MKGEIYLRYAHRKLYNPSSQFPFASGLFDIKPISKENNGLSLNLLDIISPNFTLIICGLTFQHGSGIEYKDCDEYVVASLPFMELVKIPDIEKLKVVHDPIYYDPPIVGKPNNIGHFLVYLEPYDRPFAKAITERLKRIAINMECHVNRQYIGFEISNIKQYLETCHSL